MPRSYGGLQQDGERWEERHGGRDEQDSCRGRDWDAYCSRFLVRWTNKERGDTTEREQHREDKEDPDGYF